MSKPTLFEHITKDWDQSTFIKTNIKNTDLPHILFTEKNLLKLTAAKAKLATYRFPNTQEHVKIPFIQCDECKKLWKLYKYIHGVFRNCSMLKAFFTHTCNINKSKQSLSVFDNSKSPLPPKAKKFLHSKLAHLQAELPTISTLAFCKVANGVIGIVQETERLKLPDSQPIKKFKINSDPRSQMRVVADLGRKQMAENKCIREAAEADPNMEVINIVDFATSKLNKRDQFGGITCRILSEDFQMFTLPVLVEKLPKGISKDGPYVYKWYMDSIDNLQNTSVCSDNEGVNVRAFDDMGTEDFKDPGGVFARYPCYAHPVSNSGDRPHCVTGDRVNDCVAWGNSHQHRQFFKFFCSV